MTPDLAGIEIGVVFDYLAAVRLVELVDALAGEGWAADDLANVEACVMAEYVAWKIEQLEALHVWLVGIVDETIH